MQFSRSEVERYLNMVGDENPLHSTIVPGQLIVDRCMTTLGVTWMHFTINYRKSVMIDEPLTIQNTDAQTIHILNQSQEVTIQICKN
ncbi:hypothetical protein [Staphylococcus argensis]|uniref:MaoC-like domain-containing protein n=1 Tax=Staphylococcus argensis TaxID=1607738 RepID=A0A2K4FEB6_9STAP|nr:hypothetical protein [Staphylococcus argensis]MCY6990883.1 hypothetical protein [Staphylococcus argensis]POA09265.1 hypothetical protein CD039_00460 [Staphylococcus argensis]